MAEVCWDVQVAVALGHHGHAAYGVGWGKLGGFHAVAPPDVRAW